MLNLYLAARSGAALRLDAVVEFLKENGFIGELSAEVEYPPGPDVARMFDANAHDGWLSNHHLRRIGSDGGLLLSSR